MKKFNWNYPTNMWVGENRIDEINLACKELGIKKPLFVTDNNLINSKIVLDALKILKKNNISYEVFSEVIGNPTGKNVDDGVKYFKKNECDSVIAFGGGSVLDVGKAIAFMSNQLVPIWEFEDVGDNWKNAKTDNIVPIIAIPTTAGTGSETGRASVILNEKTGVKKIIFHPKFLPSIVILDPILTVGLPSKITAATGMDALAHCLEAYCSLNYHPMADGIALEGIRIIDQWLLRAIQNGSDIKARMNMLTAASMGSTAFQKGLGAIHSLSHPVNALNNIHHGLSNAIFMPYVLTFNKSSIEKKIVSICDYLDLKNSFESFLEWILDLRSNLKIPNKLSEIMDCTKINLDQLSQMALEDPSTSGNPKKVNKDDLKKMYEYSISGKLFK